MAHKLHDFAPPAGNVTLTDEQLQQLVDHLKTESPLPVVLTDEQMGAVAKLLQPGKDLAEKMLVKADLPAQPVALSDEQFAKIVELLTPGYECAKLMLADRQAPAPMPPPPPPKSPPPAMTDIDGKPWSPNDGEGSAS